MCSLISASLYDRQLDTQLFKRLHATHYTLAPKRPVRLLGPGSYNPRTIDEIYRAKTCGRRGPYYQQSTERCHTHTLIRGLGNIPDELRTTREFHRRNNAVRLDRQSKDVCRQKRALLPPVTLYEKRHFLDERLYGPYIQRARNQSTSHPDWFKGPARSQEKSSPSMLESLFSPSNRHKGKFLPLPSHHDAKRTRSQPPPGPNTYFTDLPTPSQNPSHGFLSSTERFPKSGSRMSYPGPASYTPLACLRPCSKSKVVNS